MCEIGAMVDSASRVRGPAAGYVRDADGRSAGEVQREEFGRKIRSRRGRTRGGRRGQGGANGQPGEQFGVRFRTARSRQRTGAPVPAPQLPGGWWSGGGGCREGGPKGPSDRDNRHSRGRARSASRRRYEGPWFGIPGSCIASFSCLRTAPPSRPGATPVGRRGYEPCEKAPARALEPGSARLPRPQALPLERLTGTWPSKDES